MIPTKTGGVISKSTMDAALPGRARAALGKLRAQGKYAGNLDAIKVSNYLYGIEKKNRDYSYSELLQIQGLIINIELAAVKAEVANARLGEFSKMKR